MRLNNEINPLQKAMIENMYKSFTKSCLGSTDAPNVIKSNLWQVSSTFQKFGMTDTFCRNTDKLSAHLLKKGDFKVANIILDELGKICIKLGKTDLAEKVIEKSLQTSALMKDEIHVLARLNDLEILYRRGKDIANLTKTLKRKENCCNEILSNYEKYSKNYNSISRQPTEKNAVKVQLAFAYSDLADIYLNTNPSESLELIKKAKNIYIELGQKKEANYLSKKLAILRRSIG